MLASILFSVIGSVKERARRATCQSNLRQLALAMQQYVQDNGETYPSGFWENATYSYTKNPEVYHCPDHPIDGRDHDYEYNVTRLVVFVPPFPTKNIHGALESSFATPSTIWLNVDGPWVDSDDVTHYGRMVSNNFCGREFWGSTIHSGAGNYSYLDGHVQWRLPEEAAEVECANGPLPAPFHN